MLDRIRETRFRSKDDSYLSILEISEEDFFDVYDRTDVEVAREIVADYLLEREDDGRPNNIEIKHDKVNKIISIQYGLSYVGNDHTDYDS